MATSDVRRKFSRSLFDTISSEIFCWYSVLRVVSSSFTDSSSSLLLCSSSFPASNSSLAAWSSCCVVSSSSLAACSFPFVLSSSASKSAMRLIDSLEGSNSCLLPAARRLRFLKKDKHRGGLARLRGLCSTLRSTDQPAPSPGNGTLRISDGLLLLRRSTKRAGQRQRQCSRH